MEEMKDLRVAQAIINYWLTGKMTPQEELRALKVVDYVLDGETNESAVMRNLIGESGMNLIRQKRRGVNKRMAKRRVRGTTEMALRAFELRDTTRRTQASIAKELGVSQSSIVAWLSVLRNPETNWYTRIGMNVPGYLLEAVKVYQQPEAPTPVKKVVATPTRKVAVRRRRASRKPGRTLEVKVLGIPVISYVRS